MPRLNQILTILCLVVAIFIGWFRTSHHLYHTVDHIATKKSYLNQISSSASSHTPNIVLIIADDLGYSDLSCYGSKSIQTPHLDQLARNGILHTHFITTASVCTPSRASLFTGRYPPRTGVAGIVLFPPHHPISYLTRVLGYPQGLLQDEITIANVLQQIGYSTYYIGKWHLGAIKGHLPRDFGYDSFFGCLYSNDMSPFNLWKNETITSHNKVNQSLLSTIYATNMKHQLQKRPNNKPFFLTYAPNAPHAPLYSSRQPSTSMGGLYGDVVEEMDESVGVLMTLLKELNVIENTVVIFTSDNGPWFEGDAGTNRGRKATAFEGGFRVPLIVSWPLKTKIRTKMVGMNIEHRPVQNVDLFTTILSICNVSDLPMDRIIDGIDLSTLWFGKEKEKQQEQKQENRKEQENKKMLPYFVQNSLIAVRFGERWKLHLQHLIDISELVRNQPISKEEEAKEKKWMWLTDMLNDPKESYDVSNRHMELAQKLFEKVVEWEREFQMNPRGWLD